MKLSSGGAAAGAAACRSLDAPLAKCHVAARRSALGRFSSPLRAAYKKDGANPTVGNGVERRKGRESRHQVGGLEELCEVDVISWRERRIKARVLVAADVDSVWSVLTDYERLANFIPNLIHSRLIPCPHPGRVWLEQRGLQRALYWCIEARVLLELQEIPCTGNGRELIFSMVDGDFKKFEGRWAVKAGPRSSTATLYYEVNVIPRLNFPAIFIERIIRSDLPVNLQALAWRAERRFMGSQMKHSTESAVESADSDTAPTLTASVAASSAPRDLITSLKGFRIGCPLDRPCSVDEVHVRKVHGLLENGGTHRCVVASITVKAPVREVWGTLTSYETLTEIVPNLAISKVLLRENNKVRILQEGCKGLLYMVLHARVVLDLCETFEEEISFEQVEGDFDSFRGKWILEQLGNDHTLLKYSVESKLRRESFLSDAILEEVIYEDLPANLCAIRDNIEKRTDRERNKQQASPTVPSDGTALLSYTSSSAAEQVPRQRPKVPGLQRDEEILKAEILAFISEHGQEGFMPMRKQLRLHGRVDIEKAITRMGGFRKIASLMNLSLAYKLRKPKGYWDELENLRLEISRFQRSWGMDPAFMPSRKSFERAGRYDVARALEKWGGLQEVARLLSLELRNRRRSSDVAAGRRGGAAAGSEVEDHQDDVTRPFVSQDPQKWLMKLKELDISWVE
ncbi:polyketide cyclase/dehydrase/lipid transporter isoform X2 [Wolffia australiana]